MFIMIHYWIHLTYFEMIFRAKIHTLHKNSSAIKSPENIQQKTKLWSFAKYLDNLFALICLNNIFFWQGLHNFWDFNALTNNITFVSPKKVGYNFIQYADRFCCVKCDKSCKHHELSNVNNAYFLLSKFMNKVFILPYLLYNAFFVLNKH